MIFFMLMGKYYQLLTIEAMEDLVKRKHMQDKIVQSKGDIPLYATIQ